MTPSGGQGAEKARTVPGSKKTLTIAPSRGAHGRWTCDGCGQADAWSDGWVWFGSYALRRPYSSGRGEEARIERVLCPVCAPTDVKTIDGRAA